MKKHALVAGKEILVDRRETVDLAVNARLLLQFAQSGFGEAFSETYPAANGVVKRAFLTPPASRPIRL